MALDVIYEKLMQKSATWTRSEIPIIELDRDSNILWKLDAESNRMIGYWAPKIVFNDMSENQIYNYVGKLFKQ